MDVHQDLYVAVRGLVRLGVIEEGVLDAYKAHGVSCIHVHKNKPAHLEAVRLLAEALAAGVKGKESQGVPDHIPVPTPVKA